MSSNAVSARSTAFKAGWWVLFAISALGVVNHTALVFVMPGEEVLFIGWAAFNLYSTAVLLIPYRRGERWAWTSSWVLVASFAAVVAFDTQIGLFYAGAAVLMAAGQFLTRAAFFGSGREARSP